MAIKNRLKRRSVTVCDAAGLQWCDVTAEDAAAHHITPHAAKLCLTPALNI